MIAKNDRKRKKTLSCYTTQPTWNQTRPAQIASSQGAQDLNDLLGLPKGAIFEEGQ